MTTEFKDQYHSLLYRLFFHGEEVEVGEWQSQDISDRPEMISKELRHETFRYQFPGYASSASHTDLGKEVLQDDINPNLPWAEDHFLERVSGEPLNPPPSEAWWPFRVRGNEDHKVDEKFSHTYPERMWPRFANVGETRPNGRKVYVPHNGVRFEYGDLQDVVKLLCKNPLTRQAFLPIWFPEDTGAVDGQRVPCTLGYHFLIREGRAEIVYYIRSCDLLRHFTDDVYMACRLLQWVVGKLRDNGIDVNASSLIMHISSLHVFRGDYPRINDMLDQYNTENEDQYGAAI